MKTKILTCIAGSLAYLAFSGSTQALEDTPQSHLAKARAEAFQDEGWDYPALLFCYPDQLTARKNVVRDLPPTRVFDNVYNIGTGNVAAWAVRTSQGLILIDTLDNAQEADDYIMGGLQKLGLSPQDIKYIIITHGQSDHSGGGAELQAKIPGAHVLMSPADWKMALDNAAKPGARATSPKHDMDVTDGQQLTLGDETLTLYITPGHTPGTVSMLLPVRDHGKTRKMLFIGGTGSNDLGPAMDKAYDLSMIRLAKIAVEEKIDGYISNHPAQDDGAFKTEYARLQPDQPNPFVIGTMPTVRYFDVLRECHLYVTGLEAEGKVVRHR